MTRAHGWAFHHWLATLRAEPHCFPGIVAAGPNPRPDRGDASHPSNWPIPIWGYFGDPAFPRGENTPLEGRYTDNDSWSTNEPAVDMQAAAVYTLSFARWISRKASAP